MYHTLYSIHSVDAEKLAAVVAQMHTLGPPTIRVVDCGDHYVALEGTHRLAACAQLGIAPQLHILEQDDLIEADTLDWEHLQAGESYTAGELAGEASTYQCGCYTLQTDGTLRPH